MHSILYWDNIHFSKSHVPVNRKNFIKMMCLIRRFFFFFIYFLLFSFLIINIVPILKKVKRKSSKTN